LSQIAHSGQIQSAVRTQAGSYFPRGGHLGWVDHLKLDDPPVTCAQGLDWHGPSALDVWASVDSLRGLLRASSTWKEWATSEDKVVLIGHSNGGQGVWYLAERYPDRVIAG